MNSSNFRTAKNVAKILGSALVGLAASLFVASGKLEVKENIAREIEEKEAREERTFGVGGCEIDIDDI